MRRGKKRPIFFVPGNAVTLLSEIHRCGQFASHYVERMQPVQYRGKLPGIAQLLAQFARATKCLCRLRRRLPFEGLKWSPQCYLKRQFSARATWRRRRLSQNIEAFGQMADRFPICRTPGSPSAGPVPIGNGPLREARLREMVSQ
jgi:hypothetical protein